LSHAGCERLFEDKNAGAARRRPELEKLFASLRADDILVVTRLDRLARSTTELLRIADQIRETNAHLQSLDEPWADTTSPFGQTIMAVFDGISAFERSLILARTDDGRQAAKERGVAFGRPQKLLPDQKALARELVREGRSISAVARTFNVHSATIYRCLEKISAL
jgi:DNA invertase Pin-like site-specific DNA recombinase